MNAFEQYILQRIENNKNFLASITGPTGSGKSYSALRIAEVLDPGFSIERVAFNPLEFMQIIDKGGLTPGSVIIFDEAGVGMSHREWQSKGNKVINYLLQTFRHENLIVIFTTPHMGFIDSASRKLFHCHMETVAINKKKKLCRLKPLLVQVNQRKGDTYYKYLRVLIPGEGVKRLTRYNVPLPSKELLQAYENKKTGFTSVLKRDLLAALEGDVASKKPKLTARQQELIDRLGEGYTVDAIAQAMKISEQSVYEKMAAVKKKGWQIDPVKDGLNVKHYEVSAP